MSQRAPLTFAACLLLSAVTLAGPAGPLLAAPPDVERLARELRQPTTVWAAAWEIGQRGAEAAPLVPDLVALLGRGADGAPRSDLLTRRLVVEALGRIGGGASGALAAVRAEAGSGDEVLDVVVRRALRAIEGAQRPGFELPDGLSPAGHPWLSVLDAASRRPTLSEDDLALARQAAAWAEAHAKRLDADAGYRVASWLDAELGRDRTLKGYARATRWTAPLLVSLTDAVWRAPAGPPLRGADVSLRELAPPSVAGAERLDEIADLSARVYRGVLRRLAPLWDARPLEGPYGGRPELPIHVRSFADGFPLALVVWPDAQSLDTALRRARGWARIDDTLPSSWVTVGESGLAYAHVWLGSRDAGLDLPARIRLVRAVSALTVSALWRQRLKWKLPPLPVPGDFAARALVPALWLDDAFLTEVGVGPLGWRGHLLDRIRSLESSFRGRGTSPLPAPPLDVMLALGSAADARRWGVEHGLGDQGLALVGLRLELFGHFLRETPAYADALDTVLRALVESEPTVRVLRKRLASATAGGWDDVDRAFETWLSAGAGAR